jgi:hypothetical protein
VIHSTPSGEYSVLNSPGGSNNYFKNITDKPNLECFYFLGMLERIFHCHMRNIFLEKPMREP